MNFFSNFYEKLVMTYYQFFLILILYSILNYKDNNNDKRIPKFIFKIKDKKLLGVFIQSIFDDDGFLYPTKNMIVISQKRIKLLSEIRKVISLIGIKPNKILIHNSKNRTVMRYFTITSKLNIKKFNKYIGFNHPEKKQKLKILIKKYGGMLLCAVL